MMIVAMFMDIYHHLEDLDRVSDTAMAFTAFLCECCAIMYFR